MILRADIAPDTIPRLNEMVPVFAGRAQVGYVAYSPRRCWRWQLYAISRKYRGFPSGEHKQLEDSLQEMETIFMEWISSMGFAPATKETTSEEPEQAALDLGVDVTPVRPRSRAKRPTHDNRASDTGAARHADADGGGRARAPVHRNRTRKVSRVHQDKAGADDSAI